MRDLLSLSCSEAVSARLNMMSSYIYKQAGVIAPMAVDDPQKALEKLRFLQDEIDDAFLDIKADLGCEVERRNPKTYDDPSSACISETTNQIAARCPKPKLFDPEADAFTDPIDLLIAAGQPPKKGA